jgi:hypothetical protein
MPVQGDHHAQGHPAGSPHQGRARISSTPQHAAIAAAQSTAACLQLLQARWCKAEVAECDAVWLSTAARPLLHRSCSRRSTTASVDIRHSPVPCHLCNSFDSVLHLLIGCPDMATVATFVQLFMPLQPQVGRYEHFGAMQSHSSAMLCLLLYFLCIL